MASASSLRHGQALSEWLRSNEMLSPFVYSIRNKTMRRKVSWFFKFFILCFITCVVIVECCGFTDSFLFVCLFCSSVFPIAFFLLFFKFMNMYDLMFGLWILVRLFDLLFCVCVCVFVLGFIHVSIAVCFKELRHALCEIIVRFGSDVKSFIFLHSAKRPPQHRIVWHDRIITAHYAKLSSRIIRICHFAYGSIIVIHHIVLPCLVGNCHRL